MIKSPESAFYNLSLGNYGQVDIGALQATGTISAASTYSGIGDHGKQLVTVTKLTITGGPLKVGQTLNIAGTTDYDGLHPVIEVISATEVLIDVQFTVTKTGTWDQLGAKGFFAGFMPMTTISAGTISSMMFHEDMHIGDPTVLEYIAGIFYPFPGIIDEILLTAGDIRLMRYSNNKPQQ